MTESEPYTQLIKEVREKSQSFNPSPLIKRDFISLSDGQNENMRKDNIFRIMQWNLLAQGMSCDLKLLAHSSLILVC